jgi:hypothetical protein
MPTRTTDPILRFAQDDYTSPMSEPGSWISLTATLFLRGLLNPRLGLDLLKTAWAFRRRGWWARPPFVPLPDRDYLRWRMYTAYADEAAVPPADDVIRFARWRRETMGL